MAGSTVLLADCGETSMELLAARIGRLGLRVLRAKTPSDAYVAVSDGRLAVGAVVIPPDAPFADLGKGLARFREVASEPNLSVAVAGARPGAMRGTVSAGALAAAGVDFAIYEPIDAHALRFQLNRATAWRHSRQERRADRAPFVGEVRIRAGRRNKEGRLYTLSSHGAFISLPAPCLRGTELKLEIALPDGALVRAKGRVAMTNVRGNLQKKALPVGMGIVFQGLKSNAQARVALAVRDRLEALDVGC